MNSHNLTCDTNAERDGTPRVRNAVVIINLVETRQLLRSAETYFRSLASTFPLNRHKSKIRLHGARTNLNSGHTDRRWEW